MSAYLSVEIVEQDMSLNVAIFVGTISLLTTLVWLIPIFIILKYKSKIRVKPRETILRVRFIIISLIFLACYSIFFILGIFCFVYSLL